MTFDNKEKEKGKTQNRPKGTNRLRARRTVMKKMIVILMAIVAIISVEAAALASAPHWGACHVAPFQLESNRSVTCYTNEGGGRDCLVGGSMSGDSSVSIYKIICDSNGCLDPVKVISLSSDDDDYMAIVNGDKIVITSDRLRYVTFMECEWDNTALEVTSDCVELNYNAWGGDYFSIHENNLYSDKHLNEFIQYNMNDWTKTMVPDLSFGSNNGAYGIHVGDGYAVVALTCEAPVFCSQDVALYTMTGSGTEWTPADTMAGMNTGNTAGAPFVQEDNTLLYIKDGVIMECPASCEGVSCGDNEVCDLGVCIDPCVGFTCDEGMECVISDDAPLCQDKCLSMSCPVLCELGECYDPCLDVTCEDWEACEVVEEAAECVDQGCDPSCESWEDCFEGECFDGGCATECDSQENCFEGACVCETPLTCADFDEYGTFSDGCGNELICLEPNPCDEPEAYLTIIEGSCTFTTHCETNPLVDPLNVEVTAPFAACKFEMDLGRGDKNPVFKVLSGVELQCTGDLCLIMKDGKAETWNGKLSIPGVVTATVGTHILAEAIGTFLKVTVPEGRAWWYPEGYPEEVIIVGTDCESCPEDCNDWEGFPDGIECFAPSESDEVSAPEEPDGDTDGDIDTEEETVDGDEPDGDDPDGDEVDSDGDIEDETETADDPTDGDETPEDGDETQTPDGDDVVDGDDPIGNGATGGGGGCNATNSNTSIPFLFLFLALMMWRRKAHMLELKK